MANQFEKGRAFSPGDTVEAADLNNLVDLATALGGLILEQGAAAPDTSADSILFYDVSAIPPNRLRRCLISALGTGTVTDFTAGNLAGVFTANVATRHTTPALTFNMVATGANKFLASPADGSTADLALRAIVPKDVSKVVAIAAYAIDLTLGNLFTKTFTANGDREFTFTDGTGTPGQVFKVRVQRFSSGGTGVITWSALGTGGDIKWPSGTVPVMTVGANKVDIFEFVCTANNKYAGIRWGADLS